MDFKRGRLQYVVTKELSLFSLPFYPECVLGLMDREDLFNSSLVLSSAKDSKDFQVSPRENC